MVKFDIKQLDITKQNVAVEEVLDGHRQSAASLHSKTPICKKCIFLTHLCGVAPPVGVCRPDSKAVGIIDAHLNDQQPGVIDRVREVHEATSSRMLAINAISTRVSYNI